MVSHDLKNGRIRQGSYGLARNFITAFSVILITVYAINMERSFHFARQTLSKPAAIPCGTRVWNKRQRFLPYVGRSYKSHNLYQYFFLSGQKRSQMNTYQVEPQRQDTHSKVLGYLLWIVGFTGSHRFYYGKPVTGTIWFSRWVCLASAG
jgi:hypothetical protein